MAGRKNAWHYCSGDSLTRRSILKSLAATGAIVSSPAIRQATAQSRPLKIGFVSPQTGPIAPFGEADNFILAGVRKALDGGLPVGGTNRAVQIVVKDSQSNPSRASEVTVDLI